MEESFAFFLYNPVYFSLLKYMYSQELRGCSDTDTSLLSHHLVRKKLAYTFFKG